MIRRLELAQALVSAPRVLVLDEPTVGLDPVARPGCGTASTRCARETGMTVLVTTHAMEEADAHCDRVALMHRGRMRAVGTPAELKAALGADATLDDVFRHHTGDTLPQAEKGACAMSVLPAVPPGASAEPALVRARSRSGSSGGWGRCASSSCRSCATTAPSWSPGPCSPRCGW